MNRDRHGGAAPRPAGPEVIRAFIAVRLPDEVRALLGAISDELRGRTIAVKWVEPSNLHLTLAFLGAIAPASVVTVAAALERAVAGERAIHARLEGLGAFPNLRRPRVIWAGLAGGEPALAGLAGRVRSELAAAGVHFDDKPFSPHVTLGRMRDGVTAPSELLHRIEATTIATGPFAIRAVHFMKSRLTPSGPIYDSLRVVVLGGEGPA